MTTPVPTSTSDASDPGADMRAPERSVEATTDRRSIWTVLRTGLVASVLCHAGLILWAVGIWDSAGRWRRCRRRRSRSISSRRRMRRPNRSAASSLRKLKNRRAVPLPDLLQADHQHRRSGAASAGIRWHHGRRRRGRSTVSSGKVALANRLAESLQLPIVLPGGGIDATAADSSAKVARSIIAEFKAHLSKVLDRRT